MKAPVGLATKTGPKVKNDPKDVLLVRKGLNSNGYNIPAMGGANPKRYDALSKALASARSPGNIRKLNDALPKAEIAVNASIDDVQRFLKEFSGAAGQAAFRVGVASAVAFTIVGAMATPMLITAGMTEASAAAASGVPCKVLNSAAPDLGRAANGEKVTLLEGWAMQR